MNNILKNKSNSKEVKSMKKKGFTLIELIAVIAILGILAVVLIPNIIGYTNKAKVAKAQADAGIIVRAIDAYEAETSEQSSTAMVSNVTTATNDETTITLDVLATADKTSKLIFGYDAPVKAIPNEFTGDGVGGATVAVITITELRKMAAKQDTVKINNNKGGNILSIDGTTVSYN